MVHKIQWKKLEKWGNWLDIWKRNEKGEFSEDGTANPDIALTILHNALQTVGWKYNRRKQPINKLLNENEIVDILRFYIEKAKWIGLPGKINHFKEGIGEKAYETMIHWSRIFLPSVKGPGMEFCEVPILGELADFFAVYRKNIFFFYKKPYRNEPYRTDLDVFLRALWSGRKRVRRESVLTHQDIDFSFAQPTLSKKKPEIIKGLVNAHMFWRILQDRVFEAIPTIKDSIWSEFIYVSPPDHIIWKPETLEKYKKKFPEIGWRREKVKNWMYKELDNWGSRGFKLIILLTEHQIIEKEKVETLMKLLIRRDIQSL